MDEFSSLQEASAICNSASSQMALMRDHCQSGDRPALEQFLSNSLSSCCARINSHYTYFFRFSRIHDLLPNMHSELCVLEISRGVCTFTFPDFWIEYLTRDYITPLAKRAIAICFYLPSSSFFDVSESVKAVFELGDNGYMNAISFCSKNNFSCLIPDWDFVSSGGYAQLRDDLVRTNLEWEQRVPKIVWRGSTTGQRRFPPPPPGNPDDLRWLQRLWLCVAAHNSPSKDICDIYLSRMVQIEEPHLFDRIAARRLVGEPLPKNEIVKFKGIIDVDGNSNAWSGLFSALLSGACVFKVGSERQYRQWYYSALKPFENYVPICADFTDFDDAVEWFSNNDDTAQELGKRSKALAGELEFVTVQCQVRSALEEWLSRAPVLTNFT